MVSARHKRITSTRWYFAPWFGSMETLYHAPEGEYLSPSGELKCIVGTHLISLAFNQLLDMPEGPTVEHLMRLPTSITAWPPRGYGSMTLRDTNNFLSVI